MEVERGTGNPYSTAVPKRKTILLGVTASIAAYKAADLVGKLAKNGHEVHVLMTPDAQRFITPLTLRTLSRHEVIVSLFDEDPQSHVTHVHLADAADLLLIAPATADILAKLAHGHASDALSAVALVCRCPVLIAPAMNGKMWLHPATQHNVHVLRGRGVQFLGPEEGMLACGYEGLGRLWNVDDILAAAEKILATRTRTRK